MPDGLKQSLMAFAVAMAGIAIFVALGAAVPIVRGNLGAFVALIFLWVPGFIAERSQTPLPQVGYMPTPTGKDWRYGLGSVGLIFPLFALCFFFFYQIVCAPHVGTALGKLALPGHCYRFSGISGLHWPHLFTWEFGELVLVQFIVVALPEEYFFRGYIQPQLEKVWPAKRRFLGGGIGWAVIISSLLFAMGHLVASFDPRRLAVFFPSLWFGWLRSATGSITAGIFAHAVSNLFIYVLQKSLL